MDAFYKHRYDVDIVDSFHEIVRRIDAGEKLKSGIDPKIFIKNTRESLTIFLKTTVNNPEYYLRNNLPFVVKPEELAYDFYLGYKLFASQPLLVPLILDYSFAQSKDKHAFVRMIEFIVYDVVYHNSPFLSDEICTKIVDWVSKTRKEESIPYNVIIDPKTGHSDEHEIIEIEYVEIKNDNGAKVEFTAPNFHTTPDRRIETGLDHFEIEEYFNQLLSKNNKQGINYFTKKELEDFLHANFTAFELRMPIKQFTPKIGKENLRTFIYEFYRYYDRKSKGGKQMKYVQLLIDNFVQFSNYKDRPNTLSKRFPRQRPSNYPF